MTEREQVKEKTALDNAAALCFEAIELGGLAQSLAAEPKAKQAAWDAVCKANEAANALIKSGAKNPLFARRERPQGNDLELSALATMNTPAARELLDLLRQATAVAERVDAERGHALAPDFPIQPGESRGTDLAETLSEITSRVHNEVHGRATGRE